MFEGLKIQTLTILRQKNGGLLWNTWLWVVKRVLYLSSQV